jgi:predicted  nucleic acid-binding Zn-ribbon protein
MDLSLLITVAAAIVAVVAVLALFRVHRRLQSLARRFAGVVNVENEIARVRADSDARQKAAAEELRRTQAEIDTLRKQYAVGRARYEDLDREVASLEENLSSIDVGLYRPHFTYADSDSYKAAIERVRQQQKDLIKAGRAVVCGTSWQVGGSKREGERMVKQTEKVILRAFNAESDAAVASVSWNNYSVMETRINKTFDALNKLGTVLQVSLTDTYRTSRLDELRLVFEAAEKRQQEREEQRRQRAEQREEEKVQRELQREQEDAAKEEATYAKALAKAQAQLQAAAAGEREAMLERIRQLEADVAAARERKERAVAQAQLTKVGHVYIISNVGAFGEGVIKIGLTRRLDPEERVHELGDASVPFPFDIHAMLYSENAPDLEAKLHNHFWDRRLNWANDRKEFFRIDVAEVQAELAQLGLKAELLTVVEAKQYRQTVAAQLARTEKPSSVVKATEARFPSDLFAPSNAASPTPTSAY